MALGRLEYQDNDSSITYHSDKPTGPTVGSETTDALEFLARVVSHIPDKGQVFQRYYGWYASTAAPTTGWYPHRPRWRRLSRTASSPR